jgi:hypothetical protein
MKGEVIFAESTSGKTQALKTVPHIVDLDTLWHFWTDIAGLSGWKALKSPELMAKFRHFAAPALAQLVKSGMSVLIWDPELADQVAALLSTTVKAVLLASGAEYASRSLGRFANGEKSVPAEGIPSTEELIASHNRTVSAVKKKGWPILWLQAGTYLADLFKGGKLKC